MKTKTDPFVGPDPKVVARRRKKFMDMMFPPGSIMGFYEPPDDSWEVCDGRNGKPDLIIGGGLKHKWYIRHWKKAKETLWK